MRNMKIGRCCLAGLFLWIVQGATAQINYGTTGLMNLPTADMQRDKTFMVGGNWLNHHATVPRWWYDTWNYYINTSNPQLSSSASFLRLNVLSSLN